MIDKIWYDWQLQDPSNANLFAGGSVSIQVDTTVPLNGGPPYLNVRCSFSNNQCAMC